MLEDFYRPRWESFISRMELSLLTGDDHLTREALHEEIPFTYMRKSYSPEPCGDLFALVARVIDVVENTHIEYETNTAEEQISFVDSVAEDLKTVE